MPPGKTTAGHWDRGGDGIGVCAFSERLPEAHRDACRGLSGDLKSRRKGGILCNPNRRRSCHHIDACGDHGRADCQRQPRRRRTGDPEYRIACNHSGHRDNLDRRGDAPLFSPLPQRWPENRVMKQPCFQARRRAAEAPCRENDEDGGGHHRKKCADNAQSQHQHAKRQESGFSASAHHLFGPAPFATTVAMPRRTTNLPRAPMAKGRLNCVATAAAVESL